MCLRASQVCALHRRSPIRAPTPPRGTRPEVGRELLWKVFRDRSKPIAAHLIAFHDAVELDIEVDLTRRRRLRFLRDITARAYATRMRRHLEQRGYHDRRAPGRTTWPDEVR